MNHTTKEREFSTPGYTFSQKWGDDPFTALGHTQAPNALVRYGARLGLDAEECWLITVILMFKHTPDDPYPAQARLAELIGKSEVTIRRWLKSIEGKKLMHVEHVRGDLGHYTHSIYDFQLLRGALNEAYYQDHPQDRSQPAQLKLGQQATAQRQPTDQKRAVVKRGGKSAERATDQNCSVAEPPIKTGVHHRSDPGLATDQLCRPNKSLEREERIEEEAAVAAQEVFASLFPREEENGEEQKVLPEKLPTPCQLVSGSVSNALALKPWTQLAEDEQLPWIEKAEQELKENFGLAVWMKTTEKAKTSIRAQRAANLYLQLFGLAAKADQLN